MSYTHTSWQRRERLVSGGKLCKEEKRIAYCWYRLHPGFLTKKLLIKHDCLAKNCPFLEPFEDHPYWVQRRKIREKRILGKQQKVLRASKEKEALLRFRELTKNKPDFAVCRCEFIENSFLLTCVALHYVELSQEIHMVSEELHIQVKIRFIKNTYDIRKLLLEKIREETDCSYFF